MIRKVFEAIPKPLLVILVSMAIIILSVALFVNREMRRADRYKEEVVFYEMRSMDFGEYLARDLHVGPLDAKTGVIVLPLAVDDSMSDKERYVLNAMSYWEPGEYRYFRFPSGDEEEFILLKDSKVVADGVVRIISPEYENDEPLSDGGPPAREESKGE